MPRKIIAITDNPNGRTGLGRIGAQIFERIDAFMPGVFEVGVIGIGGPAYNRFEFPVWRVKLERDYSIPELPEIADAFSPDETPILLTIQNSGWLRWLAIPEILPKDSPLRKWVEAKRPRVWSYLPIDGEGPNGKLARTDKAVIEKLDRILAYTRFGAQVLDRTLLHPATVNPDEPVTKWIPHGTDQTVFYRRDRDEARQQFGRRIVGQEVAVGEGTLLIGVVATNTARKDWPLAFETAAILKARGEDVGLWAHTNRLIGEWDLLSLADDFGMHDQTVFTFGNLSDEDMAWGYSACDVTLGIGAEGWGMPLAESLACGTPVVTVDYAGATEFVPKIFRVPPTEFRYEGQFCVMRPVNDAGAWADKVRLISKQGGFMGDMLAPEFYWPQVWPKFEQWLREGL